MCLLSHDSIRAVAKAESGTKSMMQDESDELPTDGTDPLYVTQDIAPGWMAWFYLERSQTGALVIARVEVKPLGDLPDKGVTQSLLRKIRTGPAQRIAGLYNPRKLRVEG